MAPPRITILAVFAPGRRGPPADRVTNLVSPPARAWGQGTDGVSKVCYPFTSRCKTWIDFASQSLNDHAVRRGSMTTEIQAEANRRNALHLAPIVLWPPGPSCPRRSAPAFWRWSRPPRSDRILYFGDSQGRGRFIHLRSTPADFAAVLGGLRPKHCRPARTAGR